MDYYINLLDKQKKERLEKVNAEFDHRLYQYCKDTFNSEEYFKYIKSAIQSNIIQITNMNNWTDSFQYACSPFLKAVPLIREPYFTQDNFGFPIFARGLNDLAMLIRRVQLTSTYDIVVQDFGIFLYILYREHLNCLQNKLKMSYEQAVYSTQQLIRQFLLNVSSSVELSQPKVVLVMHDSLGMLPLLTDWNTRESTIRMQRTPYFADWNTADIASFYSTVCPVFKEYRNVSSAWKHPELLFMCADFLPKLDRLLINLYIQDYSTIKSLTTDSELLRVIKSRDKVLYTKFAEKYFKWDDCRRIYCLSRKYKRCSLPNPFDEPVIRVWKSTLRRNNKLCTFNCYNPFEVDLVRAVPFANTVMDFKILHDLYGNVTRGKIREYYLLAQTINQARRKNFSVEGDDTMFMSLNVDVVNVPEDKIDIVSSVLSQVTEDLISTYMDNFTFTVHEDITKFDDYKKHLWYNGG